jgi:dTMP kinase
MHPTLPHSFIAIEGPDGAGKSTQVALLRAYFEKQNIPTHFVHFPRSGHGVYGELIAAFLRGEFGDLSQVHPKLVSILFAHDRYDYAPVLHQWREKGGVVLVDRYVYSNIAYQCAKLDTLEEKWALQNWILHYEYEYLKIPKPSLSLFLDVPFTFTKQALENGREGEDRTYLQGKEDIHEKDLNFQKKVVAEYHRLLTSEKSMIQLNCLNSQGAMKSPGDIHANIVALIEKPLA